MISWNITLGASWAVSGAAFRCTAPAGVAVDVDRHLDALDRLARLVNGERAGIGVSGDDAVGEVRRPEDPVEPDDAHAMARNRTSTMTTAPSLASRTRAMAKL
jgi:hypothetical protein